LDAYENVYVWLGNEARQDEKTMAMDAALVSQSSLSVFLYWLSSTVTLSLYLSLVVQYCL